MLGLVVWFVAVVVLAGGVFHGESVAAAFVASLLQFSTCSRVGCIPGSNRSGSRAGAGGDVAAVRARCVQVMEVR